MKRQMRKAVSFLLSVAMVTAMVPIQPAGAEELTVLNDGIEVISSGAGDGEVFALDEGLIGPDGVTGEGNEEVLSETEAEIIEEADNDLPENLEPEMTEPETDPAVEMSDDEFVIEVVEADEISEALALNAESGEGFSYQLLEDGTAEITGYTGEQTGDLIIPDEIDGYTVSSIGEYAFSDCEGFDGSLVLPENLTRIGEGAFEACYGFTGNLVLPDSLIEIGGRAFNYCRSFTGNLNLPNALEYIGDDAFRDCWGFTGKLVLPEGLKAIGDGAFWWCQGFTGNLDLPESLVTIGEGAFGECTGFTGKLILPENLEYIGSRAFSWCSGFNGDLILPNNIKVINEYTFEQCAGLNGNLILPDSIEQIYDGAFTLCSFQGKLTLPDRLTYIGDDAFSSCVFSGTLELPDGLIYIGKHAFSFCKFTGNLTIPDNLTTIGNGAFSGLTKMTGDLIIPDSVTDIGEEAFSYGGFDGTLILPDNLQTIGNGAFYGCGSLTGSLILPSGLKSIGDNAFLGCKGLSGTVDLPEGIILGTNVFYDSVIILDDNENLVIEKQIAVNDSFKLNYALSGTKLAFPVTWKSDNEDVVSVTQSGEITALKEGTATITVSVDEGLSSAVDIHVVQSIPEDSAVELTWKIPETVKLGYMFSDQGGESTGEEIVTVRNLPENSIGKYLELGNDVYETLQLFSSAHAGEVSYKINNSEEVNVKTILLNYAIHPGTISLYVVMTVNNMGCYDYSKYNRIGEIGNPYVVTVEEPVIATNEPSEVMVGDSIQLTSELQNTELVNEMVEGYKIQIENAIAQMKYGWYDLGHNLVYEPEFVIEEGSELVECSDGDFSHTLTASEKIKFIGSGTVKIKVRYNPLPMCTLGGTYNYYYVPEKTITIQVQGKPEENEHTWNAGIVTKEATCTNTGVKTYTCTICGATKTETVAALGHDLTYYAATASNIEHWNCSRCDKNFSDSTGTQEISSITPVVPTEPETPSAPEKPSTPSATPDVHTHNWGAWTITAAATVFEAEQQVRTCSVCKETEARSYGSKLNPTMSLNASSLKLKKGQSATAFKVSGMANGDSVKSVTSNKTKILKVSSYSADGKIKLKAQKKTGTAKLIITLASGLSKTITVKVQSGTVKTTKVKVDTKKVTLKKGAKTSLVTTITPITSQQKVTYSTSNKKVATVSSKGVITAQKAGTAKITVKSGSKKATVTVKVTR